VTVVETGRPEDFSASLQWLRGATPSKTLPQLLIASAYWSAWFWDLFERSTPSAIPIVIWMTAGFTFYGIVLIRTVNAVPSRGSAFSKFGYWYILFLWYAIWLGWIPRLRGGRWHEWAAWVAVMVGLVVLALDLAVDSWSPTA